MPLSHNSTINENEPTWGTVNKRKLPLNAFVKEAPGTDPEKISTWKYPHHWVEDGEVDSDTGKYISGTMYLSKSGLAAAWAASQGARTGEKAVPAIISHIKKHRKALGLSKREMNVMVNKYIYAIEKPGFDESENEIKYRVREPNLFVKGSFRSKNITDGIRMIIGKLKTAPSPKPMVIQALRFSKDVEWTVKKARKWVSDHPDIVKKGYKVKKEYEEIVMEKEKTDDTEGNECELIVPIVKTDNLHRIVYGAVYSPDEVDAQGHFMRTSEIEKMAWRFMRALQQGHAGIDYMHNDDAGSGMVVENYIARQDEHDGTKLLWKRGSWVLGTQITDDDIWTKVLNGIITAYSISGHAEFGQTVEAKPGQKLDQSPPVPSVEV